LADVWSPYGEAVSREPRGSVDGGAPAIAVGTGAEPAVRYGWQDKTHDVVAVLLCVALLIGAVVSLFERDWFDVGWCLAMGGLTGNHLHERRTARCARDRAGSSPPERRGGG